MAAGAHDVTIPPRPIVTQHTSVAGLHAGAALPSRPGAPQTICAVMPPLLEDEPEDDELDEEELEDEELDDEELEEASDDPDEELPVPDELVLPEEPAPDEPEAPDEVDAAEDVPVPEDEPVVVEAPSSPEDVPDEPFPPEVPPDDPPPVPVLLLEPPQARATAKPPAINPTETSRTVRIETSLGAAPDEPTSDRAAESIVRLTCFVEARAVLQRL
jgi:hypothetical protein